MKLKRIFTAVIMLVFLCTIASFCTPEAEAYSYIGKCGENLSYFHLADNTIYISGSGAMYDYSESDPAPWSEVASSVRSVNIGSGVTGIGNYAFAGCSNLTSISGASNITSVGTYAFSGCSSLSANFSTLTYVGSYAFKDCASIASISVSDDTMGVGAFSGCTSLKTATLYSGDTIPENTFYNCSSLTSVTLPENLTTIEASAFEGCSAIESFNIPSTVTEIGVNAFKGCSSMTSFTIPEGVTALPEGVLSGCTALGSVAIHERVNSFGKEAFKDCSSLLGVVLPDNVIELGEGVFSGCTSLGSIKLTDNITKISDNTFTDCTALTYIELPTRVESIGVEAFKGCTALSAITLNEGLTDIGNSAFADCSALTSCTLPSSIDSISEGVFTGCTSLKSVKFMGYLTKWDEVTVGANNPLLTSDKIVTEYMDGGNIGNGIYWSVSNDGKLYINGNGEMSDFVLNNTPWTKYSEQITSVSIGDQITYVSAYAFAGLTKLTEVVIPEGITEISSGMFYGCTALTTVTGLDNITEIGESAFENCTSLVIDNVYGIPLGKRAFAGCASVERMIIAGNVIGEEAFADCTALKNVVIKNTVTEIGENAFDGCSLISANFTGTEAELEALVIGDGNKALEDVLGIYYYIRNLYIGRSSSKNDAIASISAKSDGILDMNMDITGDRYVCLGYSLTSDPDEALTGVVLYSSDGTVTDGSVEFDGITYYLISTPVTTDNSGNCVYICTTKDIKAGEPVYMVGLMNNSRDSGTFKNTESWLEAVEVGGNTPTLNGNINGISLYYTKDLSADIDAPMSFTVFIIIGICVIAVGLIGGTFFILKKKGIFEKLKEPKAKMTKEDKSEKKIQKQIAKELKKSEKADEKSSDKEKKLKQKKEKETAGFSMK